MLATPTPTPPIDPVVAALRRMRQSRGVSQQQVADSAGISRRALVSIEAGGDCTLSTLRGLCAALGMDIEPRPSVGSWPVQPTTAGYATAQEMSAHQEQRELAQALRVQAMLPFERSRWLASSWGALQKEAFALQPEPPPANAGTARHFATPDAKNRFDEERETAQALRLALSRSTR